MKGQIMEISVPLKSLFFPKTIALFLFGKKPYRLSLESDADSLFHSYFTVKLGQFYPCILIEVHISAPTT